MRIRRKSRNCSRRLTLGRGDREGERALLADLEPPAHVRRIAVEGDDVAG